MDRNRDLAEVCGWGKQMVCKGKTWVFFKLNGDEWSLDQKCFPFDGNLWKKCDILSQEDQRIWEAQSLYFLFSWGQNPISSQIMFSDQGSSTCSFIACSVIHPSTNSWIAHLPHKTLANCHGGEFITVPEMTLRFKYQVGMVSACDASLFHNLRRWFGAVRWAPWW